jgi:ubiquinone/menaquinone biosynthesis C-methylase UbiE
MSFVANGEAPALLKGTPLESLSILDGEKVLWQETGEVRHVARAERDEGSGLKYGIQFGISRMSIQSVHAPDADFARRREETLVVQGTPGPSIEAAGADLVNPRVIRLENEHCEEIVGLLNSALPMDESPIPVVIIPPAFGKTKEVLFGLALTLVQNFRAMGKPLAILRYDGIRRKGESHKDPEASEPPWETINSSTSQAVDDLKAVIDWLGVNPKIRASSVVLVTFSLAALEARVVLRDPAYQKRIHYWVSCMGALEFRDMMNRINCGLDLLEQFQLGINLDVYPILGNYIRHVPYASDIIANGVGALEQAREDMGHIDIPITWIYGQHDKWIKPEFIRDVMSVHANAPREVIQVPIGHNARTSREAMRMFGTITSLIHRFLDGSMIQPFMPSRMDMEVTRRAEKDRLPPRDLKNRKSYWHHYLIGEGNLLGFDIMAMADEYQQLMRDQLRALDLRPGDRLLDLGGGTGNFVEHLLQNLGEVPAQITIADLVPDALKQARQKLQSRSRPDEGGNRLDLLAIDLEMSRYRPILQFLDGEVGKFEEMADKVENLTLESARRIQEDYSPRLHRILRGERITPDLDDWLKTRFDLHEYRIIIDFNAAARYVQRLDRVRPEYRRLILPGTLEGNFHLPLKTGCYNKVLMSLVLSYIYNPAETLREVRRVIAPGGLLVLSSMRPDTDASGPFTRLLEKIEAIPEAALPSKMPKSVLLDSLRSFLNDAQTLSELEEAGTFDFFDPERLEILLDEAGWISLQRIATYGDPPQGYIVVAKPRATHDQEA